MRYNEIHNIILKIVNSEFNTNYKEIFRLCESEWNFAVDFLIKNRSLNCILKYIEPFLPNTIRAKTNNNKFKNKIFISFQKKEIYRIINVLESANINYVLIKGLALSQIIYNDITSRDAGDIDILVPAGQIDEAYRVLKLQLGYCQVIEDTNGCFFYDGNNPVFPYHCNYHEITCRIRNSINRADLELKKATSAILTRYIEPFISNVITIDIDSLYVRTNNLIYTFIHLVCNTYYNSASNVGMYTQNRKLRDFMDLYFFIMKFKGKMDFNKVKQIVDKMSMNHRFEYVFNKLNEIFETEIIEHSIINMFEKKDLEIPDCDISDYIIDSTNIVQYFTQSKYTVVQYYKKNNYSPANKYYTNKISAYHINSQKNIEDEQCIKWEILKCNKTISEVRYTIICNEIQTGFIFNISHDMYITMQKYRLRGTLINNQFDNESYNHDFQIVYDLNWEFVFEKKNYKCDLIQTKSGIMIIALIPVSEIAEAGIDLAKPIGYNLWLEVMQDSGLFYLENRRFEENNKHEYFWRNIGLFEIS